MTQSHPNLERALILPLEAATGTHEIDLGRRLFMRTATSVAALLAARPLAAQQLRADRTTSSPEGILRTVLESSEDAEGNIFELILDTFPAGIVVPAHHHPVAALNYVLSGIAESQYEGEPMITLRAGDSFQDHANVAHLHFRNPDPVAPVKILITHVLKKGQSFFIPGRK